MKVLAVSSISNYDLFTLKATWLNLTDPNFQCKKAESLLSNRRDAETQIRLRRIDKGCGIMKDSPKVIIEGIGFHSCLCHTSFQNPLLETLLEISTDYENGLLPEKGGTFDQSARTMELIHLINSFKAEHRQKQQELEAKRSKHG